MTDLRATLNRLNSHHVFGVSLGAGLLAIVTIVGAPYVDTFARAHADAMTAALVHGYLTSAVAAAQATLAPALIAAGFSRPPNVPAGPVKS